MCYITSKIHALHLLDLGHNLRFSNFKRKNVMNTLVFLSLSKLKRLVSIHALDDNVLRRVKGRY